MTVHCCILLASESGFDSPCLQSVEGLLLCEGSTPQVVHEFALRMLGERFCVEPSAVFIGHRVEAA